MKQGLVRLLYNFGKRFMVMCVLLCYPVSIHMLQLLSTGHPISSFYYIITEITESHFQEYRYRVTMLKDMFPSAKLYSYNFVLYLVKYNLSIYYKTSIKTRKYINHSSI